MLQVELDSLLLYFRWGLCLPGGPQSSARVWHRLLHVRRPDWLLFRKSHLTLDIFSLVRFQSLHRTLLWSASCCWKLPVEVWPHWPFGSQAWWCSSYGSACWLSGWPLKSFQRHFVKLVVPVLVHSPPSFLFLFVHLEINILGPAEIAQLSCTLVSVWLCHDQLQSIFKEM